MIEPRREDIVIGVLGTISIGTEKYVAAIGIEMKVEHSQKTALLGTAFETGTWMLKKQQHHQYQYH